ncbi:hypothetical protein GGR21_001800 [Dysgonomonas hofstadii]|uniref:Uncharacterized protein n=1 Tax=Dysgonomonas hofstadii TaxID=637886 RepID=A0A840CSN3_9BACT|nr:hypothetical protein [Dysgonomonas hofstadii]
MITTMAIIPLFFLFIYYMLDAVNESEEKTEV